MHLTYILHLTYMQRNHLGGFIAPYIYATKPPRWLHCTLHICNGATSVASLHLGGFNAALHLQRGHRCGLVAATPPPRKRPRCTVALLQPVAVRATSRASGGSRARAARQRTHGRLLQRDHLGGRIAATQPPSRWPRCTVVLDATCGSTSNDQSLRQLASERGSKEDARSPPATWPPSARCNGATSYATRPPRGHMRCSNARDGVAAARELTWLDDV